MAGVLEQYRQRVGAGLLTQDPAQAEAAALLDGLATRLSAPQKSGWFSAKPDPVTGLYLWGGVGRGKSMLMDLFFGAAPGETKRRVHFHEFMAEIQDLLDIWRKMPGRSENGLPGASKARATIPSRPSPNRSRRARASFVSMSSR